MSQFVLLFKSLMCYSQYLLFRMVVFCLLLEPPLLQQCNLSIPIRLRCRNFPKHCYVFAFAWHSISTMNPKTDYFVNVFGLDWGVHSECQTQVWGKLRVLISYDIQGTMAFFFLIDLYWSIITSQYRVSFCCTTK